MLRQACKEDGLLGKGVLIGIHIVCVIFKARKYLQMGFCGLYACFQSMAFQSMYEFLFVKRGHGYYNIYKIVLNLKRRRF